MPRPRGFRFTVTTPPLAADATPETWVTLPEVTELLRVTVVTTPETLVVTPVEAVAGLPFPDRDWGEWSEHPAVSLAAHQGRLHHKTSCHQDSDTSY